MNKLTTWDIPIGEVLVLNDVEYRYKEVKTTRQYRKLVPMQRFVSGRGKDKQEIKFTHGLPVELKEDGKYHRVID